MSRRGENIYKRKDGRWEGRIHVKQNDGSTKLCSVYAHSYTEVKEKMKKFSVITNKPTIESKTIAYYSMQWLQTVKFRNKRSTYCKYSNICRNHIIPILGNIKASNLCNEDINRFLSIDRYLAPKTLNDILCVLKQICLFAKAKEDEVHVQFDLITVRVPKKAVQVLSVEDQRRLTKYLLTDTDLIKIGIYIVICTGIRIGELCALKRESVDLKNKILHIGATMQRVQTDSEERRTEVIISEPKSASSVRDIPITENLVEKITQYLSSMPNGAYLLTGETDKFIEPGVMRYHFSKITKNCGLKKVKFHTLRHSFATRCVEEGIDVKTLSELLGHENVKITLNRYVHPSIELKRESLERLCRSAAYSPSV